MAQELWLLDNYVEGSDTDLEDHVADTGQTYSAVDLDVGAGLLGPTPVVVGGAGYLEAQPVDTVYFVRKVNQKPTNTIITIEARVWLSQFGTATTRIAGFFWRYGGGSNGKNHYKLELRGSQTSQSLQLIKNVNSAFNTIALRTDLVITGHTWHTLKAVISGSSIKIYFNGSLVIDTTDTSLPGTSGNNALGPLLGLTATPSDTHARMDWFKVYSDTPDTKKISISETLTSDTQIELNDPCSQHLPLTGTVKDHFDGPAGQELEDHVSDSGHAWEQWHGIFKVWPNFFSPGEYSSPMTLNGTGRIRTVPSGYLADSRRLIFTPRTRDYHINACFRKMASPAVSTAYFGIFWRDTSEVEPRTNRRRTQSIRGKRYELLLYGSGDAILRKRNFSAITTLASDTGVWTPDIDMYVEIRAVGSSIVVLMNGIEVFNVTDASITENGSISLNVSAPARQGGYPNNYYSLQYFEVDDSYATVGHPNKALNFTDKLRSNEGLNIVKPVFDTSFFVAEPETMACVENLELTKEDPTTKDIDSSEAVNVADIVSILKNSGCWYDEDWGFRKKITIDHTKVVTSTQTDFPMLVLLATDAELAANAQADGDDILFADSTGLVKLKHELVFYDTATGQLEAWVKIPSLSVSVDTVIYMYYGNGAASAQSDPTNVWDANYRAVYHLEGSYAAAAGEVLDSTGNNFDGEASASDVPAQVDAQVGKGQDFEESTREEILFDAMATMMGTGGKTIGPTPTFIAKGTASASAGTSLTPAYPAGMASGDLLICVIASSDPAGGSNNSITDLALPWLQKHALEGSDVDGQVAIWYRYVPEAGLSGTLSIVVATPDANAVMQAQFYAYRGCHQTSPFEGGALANGTGTTVTMPAITTTDVNRLAVAFGVNGADNAIANPTGETGGDWVESSGGEDRTTTGNDVTQDAFQAPIASPGTITGGTYAITSSGWAVRGFALIPRNFYELTVECWFKQEDTTTPANQRRIVLIPGVTATAINIGSRSSGNFVASLHDGQQFLTVNTIETISTLGTTFHYLALKRASGDTIARLDKTTKFTDTEILSDFHASSVMQLSQDSANLAWDGIIDEVRLSDVARSNDWLDTCYNNQNSPSTFYSLGSAQTSEICNTLFISLNDGLAVLDIPLLSGDRGIELLETAHINDPFGTSGNNIDKLIIFVEVLNSIEVLDSNLEFSLTDNFDIAETVGRAFEFLEGFNTAETNTISNVFELVDTSSFQDLVALAVMIQLAEGATLTEVLALLRHLPDTMSVSDVVNLYKSSISSEASRFAEKISIVRSGISETTDPDRIHSVRRSTYFVL